MNSRFAVSPLALRNAPFLLLFALATAPAAAQWNDRSGTFDASWTVSGIVHILEYKDDVRVAAGRLTGTVVINASNGAIPAFETDCVEFADESTSGGIGRCVWTGPTGGLIYVELTSQGPAGFGNVRGRFAGGTGDYEGIEGGFTFEWNYHVSGREDARLDGYTMRMTGRYHLP